MAQMSPEQLRQRRHRRLRARVRGTSDRPRLTVHRSNRGITAQVVDDTSHHTVAAASWLEPDVRTLKRADRAARVGALVAERAKAAGVTQVVFDRGGYLYHGRVQKLAEQARESGLVF